eukprot:Gb_26902 [translate_table: standard]
MVSLFREIFNPFTFCPYEGDGLKIRSPSVLAYKGSSTLHRRVEWTAVHSPPCDLVSPAVGTVLPQSLPSTPVGRSVSHLKPLFELALSLPPVDRIRLPCGFVGGSCANPQHPSLALSSKWAQFSNQRSQETRKMQGGGGTSGQ